MEEERLIILRLVQDGKITAEEGAALLQALASADGAADPHIHPAGTKAGDAGDESEQNTDENGEDLGERISESLRRARERTESQFRKFRSRASEQTAAEMERVLEHVNRAFASVMAEMPDLIHRVPKFVSNIYAKGPGHTFEESFGGEFAPDDAPVDIVVQGYNGTISVIGCNEPGYRVEVDGRIRADDLTEAKRQAVGMLTRDETPTSLHLKTHDAVSGRVNLTIYLPRTLQYQMRLATHNGSIGLDGIAATTLDVRTTNGGVELTDVAARQIDAEVTNGSFHAARVQADTLAAQSTNGSIRLQGAVPRANLRTVNGAIHITPTIESNATFDLRTVNGRITYLATEPEAAAFRLHLHTHMGNVHVDLPGLMQTEQVQPRGKARFEAQSSDFADRSPQVTIQAQSERGAIQVAAKANSGEKERGSEPTESEGL